LFSYFPEDQPGALPRLFYPHQTESWMQLASTDQNLFDKENQQVKLFHKNNSTELLPAAFFKFFTSALQIVSISSWRSTKYKCSGKHESYMVKQVRKKQGHDSTR
jgi:hypothetical protein